MISSTFLFFSFYLIFGNIGRFLHLQIFRDNLLVSEFILYLLCFFSFLVLEKEPLRDGTLYFLFFLILFSNFYGIFVHGFWGKPFFYSLRLCAMIFSANILGLIAFYKFKGDIARCFDYLLKTYLVAISLGFLIYFSFSSSEILWIFLKKFGIIFHGDPHKGRFVSTYFDPNYYSLIAPIPFLLAVLLKEFRSSTKYLLAGYFIFISLILSWSRSGIATFIILYFIIMFRRFVYNRSFKIRSFHAFIFIFSAVIAAIFIIFSFNELIYFLNRSINITEDSSALGRLISFNFGLSLFKKYPLMGVGYNYLAIYIEHFLGGSSVDSSILATLINFGVVLTLGGICCFFIWMVKRVKWVNKLPSSYSTIKSAYHLFYGYVIVVIFFSSLFNNLLYYQFWLIPIVTIFSYLRLCSMSLDIT